MKPKNLRHGPQLSSFSRESAWNPTEDTNSDTSDPGLAPSFRRSRGIWNDFRNHSAVNLALPPRSFAEDTHMNGWPRPATSVFSSGSALPISEQQNGLAPIDNYRGGRLTPDPDFLMRRSGLRNTTRYDGRDGGPAGFVPSYAGAFPEQPGQYDSLGGPRVANGQMTPASGYGTTTMSLYGQGPPAPVNSLSPHASEFTSSAGWRGEESLSKQASLVTNFLLTAHRYFALMVAQHIFLQLSRSTTVVFLTGTSIATGSTSSTRSFATMINRHLSSCNRS